MNYIVLKLVKHVLSQNIEIFVTYYLKYNFNETRR